MAGLIGIFGATHEPKGGYANVNISSELNELTPAEYAPESYITPENIIFGRYSEFRIAVSNTWTINGEYQKSYFDDFYNRIHITPKTINFGNIVSEQQATVDVWNAYLEPRNLLAITGEEVGLSITGPEPDFEMTATQELTWTINATIDGVFNLDADIAWVFSTETATLNVLGKRIQVFPFFINWSDGVQERLEWLTDVLTSAEYFTQRRQLRLHPRRYLSSEILLDNRDRQAFDMAIFGWGGRDWLVPIWFEIQQLNSATNAGQDFIACDTQFLDFSDGGNALLIGETIRDYEAVEIAEVQETGLLLARNLVKSWPVLSRIYPARTGRLVAQPRLNRKNDAVQKTDVEFMLTEVSSWPAVMPATTYLGYPVLTSKPAETNDLTSTFQRILTTLDISGAIPVVSDATAMAMPLLEHADVLVGREEKAAYRSFVYALAGRSAAIWVQTFADDLTPISFSSDAISIENIGAARYALGQPGRRHIAIELHTGEQLYRQISSIVEIDENTELVSLNSSFDPVISALEVARISWLFLAAKSSDTVEFKHETDSHGLCTTTQNFIGVRDDEF